MNAPDSSTRSTPHSVALLAAALVCAILAATNVAVAQANEAAELVRDGQTRWTLFVPESAGPVERFAARELVRYVEKISGATLATGSTPDAPQTIQLGLRSAIFAAELPPAKVGFDGYAIRIHSDRILIAGDNPRGVLYGVYDLLERAGCRWYLPNLDPAEPEVVPNNINISLPAGVWAEASPLEYRICNASSLLFEIIPERLLPQIDWAAKNRYNGLSWQAHHEPGRVQTEIQQMADCGALDAMTERGSILHGPGHCFPFFLATAKYFDAHPDWFGLADGKRQPHGGQWPIMNFCWSNEAAVAEFIHNAEAFVRQWPQLQMLYMVGIDGGVVCQCPKCAARGGSDLIVDLFNRLSDRLAEAAPAVIVETVIGYGPLQEPPRTAKPNGKWRGLYAHWGRHHRQAYGDADYAKKANLEAWTALFPRYTVCSYYAAASHQPFNSPPFLHAIVGDTKYLVEREASGHLTLQYPHGYWWSFSFNLAAAAQHAYYYPARGPQEQLQDYAMSYFGSEAGPVVADYLARLGSNERLEASYRASRGDAEDEHMARLRKLQNRLRPAIKLAAGEPVYAHRVTKLTETMEFLLHLGPIRAKVHAVEAAAKEYEAGTATRGKVEGLIAEARADIVEIQAHADRLEATLPGVMDANWLKGWTLNRTCSEPLDRIEKRLGWHL